MPAQVSIIRRALVAAELDKVAFRLQWPAEERTQQITLQLSDRFEEMRG